MLKNRTIFQITPYYPPHLGGLENCVKEISERLSQYHYHVSVITSDIGYNKTLIKNTIPVHYLKSVEIANTPISLQLIRMLNDVPKNALLHIHIANAYFPEISYVMARIKKLPYIVHYHIDVDPSGILGFILPLYKKVVLKTILQHAAKTICLTKSQKDFLIQKYTIPEKNIVIIPNGVNDSFFLSQPKKNFSNHMNLLFVGRLSPQKNLDMLITSMSLIKSHCTLHIVGSGTELSLLKALKQKLQLSHVVFHGHKEGEELLQFYKEADMFILPSLNEGMSLALLEATASGLPIITTDLPQTRDFLQEGALFVKKPSASALAGAIDTLSKNPHQRQQMSMINIKNAKKYSWDKVVKKIDMIYTELL